MRLLLSQPTFLKLDEIEELHIIRDVIRKNDVNVNCAALCKLF